MNAVELIGFQHGSCTDHGIGYLGGDGRAVHSQTLQPPSITLTVPVVKADSSLARYTASDAISSGEPKRPVGWRCRKNWRASGPPPSPAMRSSSEGVCTVPGHIALQRMPLPT